MPNATDDGTDPVGDVIRDDEVLPGLGDLDASCESAQALGDIVAKSGGECCLIDRSAGRELSNAPVMPIGLFAVRNASQLSAPIPAPTA